MAGDFNEVLVGEDKFGGRSVNLSRAMKFQEFLNNCRIIDLCFSRPRFTWSNLRPLSQLVQERIDKVFVNAEWYNIYPEASVTDLERAHSDHSTIVLKLKHEVEVQFPRPFRFQPMWLSYPSFSNVVRATWSASNSLDAAVTNFAAKAKEWNTNHFGNIFHRKRRLGARLKGVQSALTDRPSSSLIDLERGLRAEY